MTTLNILLTSTSPLKAEVLKKYLNQTVGNYDLSYFDCENVLPEQPEGIDCGYYFAYERIILARQKLGIEFNEYDRVYSIENGYSFGKDICYIILLSDNNVYASHSHDVAVDPQIYGKLSDQIMVKYQHLSGYNKTIGEFYHDRDNSIDPKNWHTVVGHDRKHQIVTVLNSFSSEWQFTKIITSLKNAYIMHPDFPKKGVLFADVFPLIADPTLFSQLMGFIEHQYNFTKIDLVIGLEERGFILGAALAERLHAGFIPVRKAGKLPGEAERVEYSNEYDTDAFEMQKTDNLKGKRVLIIDDLIATGGSLRAAVELVNKLGGKIVDSLVLKEVKGLLDKDFNIPFTVLLK